MTEPPPAPPRAAQKMGRQPSQPAKTAPLPVDRRRLARHTLGPVAEMPQDVDKSEEAP